MENTNKNRICFTVAFLCIVVAFFVVWGMGRFSASNGEETRDDTMNETGGEVVYDFASCLNAGFPIREKYPRECEANGVLYEEAIITPVMTEEEAKVIAQASCIKGGESLGAGSYDELSYTWWFDANFNSTRPGCNPACVVDAKTKMAEINWRCVGSLNN